MSIRRAAFWLLAGVGVMTAVAAARRRVPWVLARIFRVRRAGLELSPDDCGLVAQDVTIAGPNGAMLRGWFAACPGDDSPRPAVLVIHGWNGAASLMLPIAPALHAAGAHAFFLDARCHGRSDDDRFASMPRFAEDIEAGLRWLRSDSRVEPECVVVIGPASAGPIHLRQAVVQVTVRITSAAEHGVVREGHRLPRLAGSSEQLPESAHPGRTRRSSLNGVRITVHLLLRDDCGGGRRRTRRGRFRRRRPVWAPRSSSPWVPTRH